MSLITPCRPLTGLRLAAIVYSHSFLFGLVVGAVLGALAAVIAGLFIVKLVGVL